MELYEIIYLSLATREMSNAELTELLEQSRQNNTRLNITGLLLYHKREFMQLLEGDKDDVLSLYDRICEDERHTQHHVLLEGPIKERSFTDWSMGFLLHRELSLEGKPGYSSFRQDGFNAHLMDAKTRGKTFLISLRDDFLRK